MISFRKHLDEKLKATDKMGDWVKDFQDSDAPQFKGKSKEKRRQMAVAAKLGAERAAGMREEVELDEVSTEKLRDYASAALQDKNKAKADKRWKYAGKAMQTVADREVKAAHDRKYNKMEEVELDEQTQYDLVEAYLLENNIDVDTLSVEQLDEIIGKVIGGAFKVGAKAAVGAARGVKKAANRMTVAGRADAAEKRADAAEKRNKDRERIEKARNRLRDAQNAARDNQTQN